MMEKVTVTREEAIKILTDAIWEEWDKYIRDLIDDLTTGYYGSKGWNEMSKEELESELEGLYHNVIYEVIGEDDEDDEEEYEEEEEE